MKIHFDFFKFTKFKSDLKTMCGLRINKGSTSDEWKDVSCKRCVKQKDKIKIQYDRYLKWIDWMEDATEYSLHKTR